MSLTAGTRLGPYEIIARVGAGGMGSSFAPTPARRGFGVTPSVFTLRWRR